MQRIEIGWFLVRTTLVEFFFVGFIIDHPIIRYLFFFFFDFSQCAKKYFVRFSYHFLLLLLHRRTSEFPFSLFFFGIFICRCSMLLRLECSERDYFGKFYFESVSFSSLHPNTHTHTQTHSSFLEF